MGLENRPSEQAANSAGRVLTLSDMSFSRQTSPAADFCDSPYCSDFDVRSDTGDAKVETFECALESEPYHNEEQHKLEVPADAPPRGRPSNTSGHSSYTYQRRASSENRRLEYQQSVVA